MKRVLLIAGVGVAMTAGAVVATATPSSGVAGPILSRGNVTQAVALGENVTKTVTKKVKVRVRGKTYTRRVKVKVKTIDPVIACSATSPCDTAVQQVTITPGGSTGWHTHPGATFVTVAEGEGKLYHAGAAGEACHSNTYTPGQGFYQTEKENHVLRNEGSVNLVVHALYILPRNTPSSAIRTDQPQPPNCPSIG